MLKAPATINKVTTMSDNTLRLFVDCQEMTPEDEFIILQLRKKLGWFVFSDVGIKEEDIPTEQIEFKDEKTLDERLNSVLFAYHMAKTNDQKSFHTFKRDVYETIIQRYKDRLSEITNLNV